jgi:NAD(P)-dependent dehydrogenase (short-subunit alcohol dehydrogenase family)
MLKEKVALVTGGASGIGLAAATTMARQGARVFIGDVQDELGQKSAASIGGEFVHLDVSAPEDWSACISLIEEKAGRLDILVNNAGIAAGGTLETETLEGFNRTLAVNLTGVFLGCQAAVPLMSKTGDGSIINVSSVFGQVADQFTLAYSASKGGVRAMTKAIALDCAARNTGIRVNSIHPGFAATPMVATATGALPEDEAEAYAARTVGQTPMGRIAEPDDIGDVIAFLASDASRYMTGSEVVVDGGFTAR